MLDLGAGTGALTAPLLDAGPRVVAVELHAERAADLRARFAGAPVTVVRADLTAVRLPRRPFKVVANPPFAHASAIVRVLGASPRLQRADLVVPLHTARRLAGGPVTVSSRLPRSAFVPRPSVDVAIVTICNPEVAP